LHFVWHVPQMLGRADVDRSDPPSTAIHVCVQLGILVVISAMGELHRADRCIALTGEVAQDDRCTAARS
jgi:hypothetical protein